MKVCDPNDGVERGRAKDRHLKKRLTYCAIQRRPARLEGERSRSPAFPFQHELNSLHRFGCYPTSAIVFFFRKESA
jgi:hypothetical protein